MTAHPLRSDAANALPFDLITVAAVVYLALPNLAFLGTWLQPWIGYPAIVLLVSALYILLVKNGTTSPLTVRHPTGVILMASALAWAAFGGAGHIGYANPDWLTRDAVYGELIRDDWPVYYRVDGDAPLILRTALGYYLPPALASMHIGLQHAEAVLYLWTALGVSLFLLATPLSSLRSPLALAIGLLVIVLFSGMDALGHLIRHGYWPDFPFHIEWWAGKFQYSSMSTQLAWVPNHAIPAWIGTALIFRHYRSPMSLSLRITVSTLLLIWSPFAALGLLPFLVPDKGESCGTLQHLRVPIPIAAAVVATGIVVLTYLSAGITAIPVASTLPENDAGSYSSFIVDYATFIVLEFGLLGLALYRLLPEHRPLIIRTALFLSLLPIAKLGPGNDVVMRASIPGLTLFCLLTVLVLSGIRPADKGSRLLLACLLALGCTTAIHELGRAVVYPAWTANHDLGLKALNRGHVPYHYAGRPETAWQRAIIRPPVRLN